MIENIKRVGNPLTIIAVFAGLAEISGTIVLPLLEKDSQYLYIWFLMTFPTVLVVLFFLTLNFNHKVLYAPSDYSNEDNFVKTFDLNKNEEKVIKKSIQLINDTEIYEPEINYENVPVHVSNVPNANQLISALNDNGIEAEIYKSIAVISTANNSVESHKAIWIGRDVNISFVKDVLKIAYENMPHLEYIHISGDLSDNNPPDYVHRQIFIGGATSTAKRYGLIPFSKSDFLALLNIKIASEFYDFIRTHYTDATV